MTTSQSIMGPHFSRTHQGIMEKAMRVEIDNLDASGMYFFSCNPDPATKIDLQGTYLCSLSLVSQWHWLSQRLDHHAQFLYPQCSFMGIVPERTAEGNIHFHAIVTLANDFEEFDIRRLFWEVLDANIANTKVRKHSVNIKPITDTGVVDYLFHKDAHDYEVIFDRKVQGIYPFECMILHNNNLTTSSPLEDPTEDSSPRLIRRKREPTSQPPKKKH